MKKQFFTFLMMIALVIVAGKAMAQSTPAAPYAGATENYSVSGLTTGDTYYFIVTANTVTTPDYATISGAPVADVTIATATSTVPGSGTVATDMTFGSSIANGTVRRIWFITLADGCYNYQYKDVTIVNYTVVFDALALGDDAGAAGESTTTAVEDCSATATDPSSAAAANGGTTTLYFKVTRTATPNTVEDNWSFTGTITADVLGNITSAKYGSTAAGALAGTDFTLAGQSISVTAGTEVIYVALVVDNSIAQDNAISLAVINAQDDSSLKTNAVNTVTNTLKRLPTTGTFAF
jgi:hypothetical protein